MMIGEILAEHTWLWLVAWQTTVALAIGLGGSLVLRRRAVRAHQLLLLALIATLAVPALSVIVRQHQWGLLEAKPTPVIVERNPLVILDAADTAGVTHGTEAAQTVTPMTATPVSAPTRSALTIEWPRLALLSWIVLSAALFVRLAIRFLLGYRLARRSVPCDAQEIAIAIKRAKTRLGIDRDVWVRHSANAHSPVIWCWGTRPILLVPEGAAEGEHIDWPSIACHELAHWKRRDHLSSLWAELVLCALPWNPFAWAAQRRLKRLSEQACDDWVIAAGQVGTRYARTLLSLTPQGRAAIVPAVVSSRRSLAHRVRRILDGKCNSPHSGRRWSLFAAATALGLAVAIAFAQSQPAVQAQATEVVAADANSVALRLLDPSGRVVAGAKMGSHVRVREQAILGSNLDWGDGKVSDANGLVFLDATKRFESPTKREAVYILHETRRLGTVHEFDPNAVGKTTNVLLSPVCRIRGHMRSPYLDTIGMPLGATSVFLGRKNCWPLSKQSLGDKFEFLLPAGQYELQFKGFGGPGTVPPHIAAETKLARIPLDIPQDRRQLDIGAIKPDPTKITELIGRQAPPLGPIKAWRNGSPVTLADLRGQAVVIYFDWNTPETSFFLPRLIELHNALGDKGVTIIGLYNCTSLAELDRQWKTVHARVGGVTEVPFRIAIDGGTSTLLEGTGQQRAGATYGRYDVTGDPTCILIDPAGNVAGYLDFFYMIESVKAILGREEETTTEEDWKQRFHKVYRLGETEILKHIAPPFLAEREKWYYDREKALAEQNAPLPSCFFFSWMLGRVLDADGKSSRAATIEDILTRVIRFKSFEYEGSHTLLDVEVPGDWIVRHEATREARLHALEELFEKRLGIRIKVQKRTVERDVIVVRGRFEFQPLHYPSLLRPNESITESVHLYAVQGEPDRGTGSKVGPSLSRFLESLGDYVGIPVVDQAEPSQVSRVLFRYHHSANQIRSLTDQEEKVRMIELLFANLTRQTGLSFTIEKRPAEVWFATEDAK